MKFVFASYVYVKEFSAPQAWLHRISAYKGVLEALSKKHEVISLEQIDFEGRCLEKGVDYRFVRFSPFSLRFFPWKQNILIKHLKPDVVVVHGMHFSLQLILLRLMLGRKVRIIVQNHAEKPFKGIRKKFQQLALRLVDALLFASSEMGAEWLNAGNLSAIKKVHEVMEVSSIFCPIDAAKAHQHTGISAAPSFLWIGRLNENKDPLTVVRAFLDFQKATPAARLYMIYQTEELLPAIQALIGNEKESNPVQLIGKVAHEQLLYWFNSATFILSGSHHEGSGAAICEAMSCGCIPILTDIPAFRMISKNGEAGLIYETGSAASLIATLQKTRTIDISSARNLVLEHFHKKLSFGAIAADFDRIASAIVAK